MDIPELVKYLSPVAILGLIWSISQYFIKRKHEKVDRERNEKKEYLTDLLMKINNLRNSLVQIDVLMATKTQELASKMNVFKEQYHEIINEENGKLIPSFKELPIKQQEEIIESSSRFLDNNEYFDEENKVKIKRLTTQLHEKNLEIKSDIRIVLYADSNINSKFLELTTRIKKYTINQLGIIDSKKDRFHFFKMSFNKSSDLIHDCFELEKEIILALKKL